MHILPAVWLIEAIKNRNRDTHLHYSLQKEFMAHTVVFDQLDTNAHDSGNK